MARKIGALSSIPIPLSTLVAKLGRISPHITVKVSKGWIDAIREAHDIDLEANDSVSTLSEEEPNQPLI